jgi:hypothetical protein
LCRDSSASLGRIQFISPAHCVLEITIGLAFGCEPAQGSASESTTRMGIRRFTDCPHSPEGCSQPGEGLVAEGRSAGALRASHTLPLSACRTQRPHARCVPCPVLRLPRRSRSLIGDALRKLPLQPRTGPVVFWKEPSLENRGYRARLLALVAASRTGRDSILEYSDTGWTLCLAPHSRGT